MESTVLGLAGLGQNAGQRWPKVPRHEQTSRVQQLKLACRRYSRPTLYPPFNGLRLRPYTEYNTNPIPSQTKNRIHVSSGNPNIKPKQQRIEIAGITGDSGT